MLDRQGGEKARATSIVRYTAGSNFPRHEHPGGEEILVLSGNLSEGRVDYPAGWYLRNPPGSSHQPSSKEGAVIFVKLWQMSASERGSVRIDTRDTSRWETQRGRRSCLLFASDAEHVTMQRLMAGNRVFDGFVNGAEILILEGTLSEGQKQYVSGSWLRLPSGHYPDFIADVAGASIYLKTGHLAGQNLPTGDYEHFSNYRSRGMA